MTIPPFSFLQLNVSSLPLHVIGSLSEPVYAQLMSVHDGICVCQIILPISFHTIPHTQIVLLPLQKVQAIQLKDLPKEYQETVSKTQSVLKEFYHWTDEKPSSSLVPLNNYIHDDREETTLRQKNVEQGKKDLHSYYLFNLLSNTNPHLQWQDHMMVIGQVKIESPFTKATSLKKDDPNVERIQSMLDAANVEAKVLMDKHTEYSSRKKTSTTWAGLVKQSSPSSPAVSHSVENSSPESVEQIVEGEDKKRRYSKRKYSKPKTNGDSDRHSDRDQKRNRGRGRGRGRGYKPSE
eukprot:NODE_355_length_8917_cov_1.682581.p5 type:complete len:293 gc:universal NODE_355_length_8917_cov_1.682581:5479-4601(-)